MVLTNHDIDRAETRIMDILHDESEPVAPSKLFDLLREKGISPLLVRAAIWYLIDRDEVTLTSDRLLKSIQVKQTSSALELARIR